MGCILIAIPIVLALRKVFPSAIPVFLKVRSTVYALWWKSKQHLATWKQYRKERLAKKELERQAKEEPIIVAQQQHNHLQPEESYVSNEFENNQLPVEETIVVQVPSTTTDAESLNQSEDDDKNIDIPEIISQPTQQATDKTESTDEVSISSRRKTTHSSDIDQQKFQKQLESLKYAALTYKERGKTDKYEKKLIEWLSLDQNNQEFMNLLADHYFATGKYVKALTLLKKIVTKQTTNHKAVRQIWRIYQAQEKPEAAQLLIEKALEQKPDHPKYLISLVEVHYDKWEKRHALEIMERLRKIRPTNIDYLLTVATLHEELNEPTFAKNYYMKILELDPWNEHARLWLKWL